MRIAGFLCLSTYTSALSLSLVPEATIRSRAEAAILASFVADASAMPLHWQYDTAAIANLVKGLPGPEFFVPPQNIWYNGVLGGNTPYGQQALAYLSTGASTGAFAPEDVEAAYWKLYNPATCPGKEGGWYLDESTRGG